MVCLITIKKAEKERLSGVIQTAASAECDYPRCLIHANKTFMDFLKGKTLKAPEKYYVAVTRAKYSNAIVVDSLFGATGFEKCKIMLGGQEIEAEKFICS